MLLQNIPPYRLTILALAVLTTIIILPSQAYALTCLNCGGGTSSWFRDYQAFDLGDPSGDTQNSCSGNLGDDSLFSWDWDSSLFSWDWSSLSFPENGEDSLSSNDGSGDGSDSNNISGDPINSAIGNVIESVRDYRGNGPFSVSFTRSYNSLPMLIPGFINSLGGNWRGNYDANIVTNNGDVYAYRPDGRAIKFSLVRGTYASASDIVDTLRPIIATLTSVIPKYQTVGWIYTTASRTVETYDINGRLKSIVDRNGLTQTLVYDNNGLLTSVTDPAGRMLKFVYDASNRLSTLIRPDGTSVKYAYDATNNLTTVTHPDGTTTGYQYQNSDFPSLLTGRVDAKGVVVSTWTYDNQGRAIGNQLANGVAAITVTYNQDSTDVTDVRGVTRTRQFQRIGSSKKLVSMTVACGDCDPGLARYITYDSNGFVASSIDFNGRKTQYTRNRRGLILTQTVAAGTPLAQTTTYTWNQMFPNPTSIVLPNNRSTHFEYDYKGNLTKRTITANNVSKISIYQDGKSKKSASLDGESRASIYQYNNSGQLITITDPGMDGKKITTLTYDTHGNLASITNALNQSIRFTEYDANGQLLSMTDPRGLSTTFTYDVNGRLISTTTGALTRRYAYNANGQLDTTLLANGSSIAYDYDAAHRLIDLTDGRVNTLHLTRDLGGRITQRTMIDPNNTAVRSHAFVFDQRGRLQQQSGNNGQVNAYGYDKEGNLLSVLDALGRTNQVQYDALLRTTRLIDATGNPTLFGYDANNSPTSVTSPRGAITQYQRDGFGQTVKLTSPDSGKTQYQYDISGNLIAFTDAKGQATHIDYDVLDRPTLISYADSQQVSLTYDQSPNGIGRLTAIDNHDSGNAYQYDINGRITLQRQKIGAVIKDLQYGYTAIGEMISQQYPSGITVQYTYTVDGKIDSLLVNGSPLLNQIQYQADGKISQWTWGNTLLGTRKVIRNFDTDGRLSSYSKATSNATIAYDNANRIINLSDTSSPALTQNFAYYFNDSLTNYTDNAMTRSYEYDADGNRGTEIGNTSSTAIAYLYATDSNHLMQLKGARTERFEYDAVGNIVSDATNKYTYNTSNQLVNVSNPAGSTGYLFDPLGQRVAKLASGDNVTYFTYDIAGRLIGEYNHSQSTEYVWMGNSPVAVLKKNGGDPAQLYTIHTDHLGTPRQVTNAVTNEVVWEWSGEPFGTSTPNEYMGTATKFTLNLRYAGQYYDQESNLFHNGFRDYNPQIGRYVQSDPIGLAGGINTYGYVGGNPVSYTDPLGLWPMYGNWGGENYSGGKWQPTIPSNPAQPVDTYDACAMQHDYCYAATQSPQNSNSCQVNPSSSIAACDLQLYYCTVAVPSGTGGLVGRIWGTVQGTWALLKAAGGK